MVCKRSFCGSQCHLYFRWLDQNRNPILLKSLNSIDLGRKIHCTPRSSSRTLLCLRKNMFNMFQPVMHIIVLEIWFHCAKKSSALIDFSWPKHQIFTNFSLPSRHHFFICLAVSQHTCSRLAEKTVITLGRNATRRTPQNENAFRWVMAQK